MGYGFYQCKVNLRSHAKYRKYLSHINDQHMRMPVRTSVQSCLSLIMKSGNVQLLRLDRSLKDWMQVLLLITLANSFDTDQARQHVGPDLNPNCLTL